MNLSTEQQYALHQFQSGKNLFVTGPGGTGKTKLIQHFVEYAKTVGKIYQVCALTGCAALLLNCNARTIHSWSGIKTARGKKDYVVSATLRNKRLLAEWRKTQILIVDEVSMMSEKIFDILNEVAQKTRRSSLPFGGIQVIFTGDFYQLPPVPTPGEPETERFCFQSNCWHQIFSMENHIVLNTIFRQTDPLYIEILLEIRKGNISEKNVKILQQYVKRGYNPEEHNECIPVKLFPIRSKVDFVNNTQFAKLQEKEYVFESIRKTDCRTYIESGALLSTESILKSSKLSVEELECELDSLESSTPSVKILRLKKGAAVMCTANIDMDAGICNGSQGIIIDILEKSSGEVLPVVKFANGVVRTMQIHYWQHSDYPTLAIGQYPLCLAWALTIHKIQGATMSMAEIDIGFSVFEFGQTYVALSRIQSLHGLYLSAFQPQKIMTNPIVNEFYSNIPPFDYDKFAEQNCKTVLDFESYKYQDIEIKKIRL